MPGTAPSIAQTDGAPDGLPRLKRRGARQVDSSGGGGTRGRQQRLCGTLTPAMRRLCLQAGPRAATAAVHIEKRRVKNGRVATLQFQCMTVLQRRVFSCLWLMGHRQHHQLPSCRQPWATYPMDGYTARVTRVLSVYRTRTTLVLVLVQRPKTACADDAMARR